jgi:MHS family proline/betaine transporter-like MFS transporter
MAAMDHDDRTRRRRTILAGIAGNVMEWYDFSVYGYFAAVIGRQFFPAKDPASSLLASFGVFAAGFLMRPIGSLVFGHVGDKLGRKSALTASVLMMAVPTFLVGLLPTWREIGVAASALLVLLRLLQGMSVGGEWSTSAIFLVERSAPGRRGRLGSLATSGACVGVLLGSGVGAALTTILPREAVESWGWRVPFLVGVILGGVGLWIRRNWTEAPPDEGQPAPARSPVREAFAGEWRMILRLIGLNAMGAVSFYLCFVYVTTWLRQVDRLETSQALDINTVAIAALALLVPAAGALSDRIGRKPLLLTAAAGVVILAWPLFWLMSRPDPWVILAGQLGFAVLSACFWGASPTTMVEIVPSRLRCTIVAVGYNTGLAILGGLTPIAAVYAIERTGDDLSPAFLVMAAAAVSLAVIAGLPESYRWVLPGTAERQGALA